MKDLAVVSVRTARLGAQHRPGQQRAGVGAGVCRRFAAPTVIDGRCRGVRACATA